VYSLRGEIGLSKLDLEWCRGAFRKALALVRQALDQLLWLGTLLREAAAAGSLAPIWERPSEAAERRACQLSIGPANLRRCRRPPRALSSKILLKLLPEYIEAHRSLSTIYFRLGRVAYGKEQKKIAETMDAAFRRGSSIAAGTCKSETTARLLLSVRNRDHYAGAECHPSISSVSSESRQLTSESSSTRPHSLPRPSSFRPNSSQSLWALGMIEYQRDRDPECRYVVESDGETGFFSCTRGLRCSGYASCGTKHTKPRSTHLEKSSHAGYPLRTRMAIAGYRRLPAGLLGNTRRFEVAQEFLLFARKVRNKTEMNARSAVGAPLADSSFRAPGEPARPRNHVR